MLSLVLHTASHHLERRRHDGGEWVETNPGVGLRVGSWQFGVYRNSWGRTSAYALRDVGPFFFGVATGYPMSPVTFAAGLSIDIGRVRVRVAPPIGGSGVIAAEVKVW